MVLPHVEFIKKGDFSWKKGVDGCLLFRYSKLRDGGGGKEQNLLIMRNWARQSLIFTKFLGFSVIKTEFNIWLIGLIINS